MAWFKKKKVILFIFLFSDMAEVQIWYGHGKLFVTHSTICDPLWILVISCKSKSDPNLDYYKEGN